MTIELPLAGAPPHLEISLRKAALEVRPGGHEHGSARFIPAGEEDPHDAGERFAVRTREAEEGGAPIVSVEEQRIDHARKGRLVVQVPAATGLRIRSRNGEVDLRDLAGELHVRTRNGAIHARGCRGPLAVAAANGTIHLAEIAAPSVAVSAANGSVDLNDVATPRLRVSTSNGRVRLAGGRIGGGTVRTANGRVALQVTPLAAEGAGAAGDGEADAAGADDGDRRGRLVISSANGPVTVALPEQIDATVKARTGGVLRNHLGSARSRTDGPVTTLQFGSGAAQFLILINNLRGGIEVTRHADFESGHRAAKERFFDDDGGHEGIWFDVDFGEEFPRFMRDMKEFGMKFGRLGEEVSREMRRAFRFGGPDADRGRHRRWHEERSEPASDETAEKRGEDAREEVKTVLDLLKEGKVSVEEAERLIAALRR